MKSTNASRTDATTLTTCRWRSAVGSASARTRRARPASEAAKAIRNAPGPKAEAGGRDLARDAGLRVVSHPGGDALGPQPAGDQLCDRFTVDGRHDGLLHR